jgi:hypothetical protein
MRKALAVALAVGLLAGAYVGPAEAAKKKKKAKAPVKVERVVEVEYQGPGIGIASPAASGGICPFGDYENQECIEIPLQLGEKYVKVEMTDATGQKVAGFVSQGDTDGDGVGNLYGDFCGAHEESVEMLSESNPLRVSFYNGFCDNGTPSVATTGTIKVTFSNLP